MLHSYWRILFLFIPVVLKEWMMRRIDLGWLQYIMCFKHLILALNKLDNHIKFLKHYYDCVTCNILRCTQLDVFKHISQYISAGTFCRQLTISLILLQNQITCLLVKFQCLLFSEVPMELQLELVHSILR